MTNGKLGGAGNDSPLTFKEEAVWRSRITQDAARRGITVSSWLRLAVRRMLRGR